MRNRHYWCFHHRPQAKRNPGLLAGIALLPRAKAVNSTCTTLAKSFKYLVFYTRTQVLVQKKTGYTFLRPVV